jgi:hypothetical protein
MNLKRYPRILQIITTKSICTIKRVNGSPIGLAPLAILVAAAICFAFEAEKKVFQMKKSRGSVVVDT